MQQALYVGFCDKSFVIVTKSSEIQVQRFFDKSINCRTYAFECRKSASAYRILVDMECTVQKTSTDIENKVSNA